METLPFSRNWPVTQDPLLHGVPLKHATRLPLNLKDSWFGTNGIRRTS